MDEDVVDEARGELEGGPVDVDALKAAGGGGLSPSGTRDLGPLLQLLPLLAGMPRGGRGGGAIRLLPGCTSGAWRWRLRGHLRRGGGSGLVLGGRPPRLGRLG